MDNLVNSDICTKCGGLCCKRGGCTYFVSDFENIKIDVIEKALDSGRVSIIATLEFDRLPSGKLIANPILFLRARNVGRGEIDLFSFQTTCASLEEKGCHFSRDERPGGGLHLIPNENRKCYSDIDESEEIFKWEPYQKLLIRIVKRRTGMSVLQRLKQDIENVLFNYMSGNVETVYEGELLDIKNMIPMLQEVFPDVVSKALERCNIVEQLKLQRKRNK